MYKNIFKKGKEHRTFSKNYGPGQSALNDDCVKTARNVVLTIKSKYFYEVH